MRSDISTAAICVQKVDLSPPSKAHFISLAHWQWLDRRRPVSFHRERHVFSEHGGGSRSARAAESVPCMITNSWPRLRRGDLLLPADVTNVRKLARLCDGSHTRNALSHLCQVFLFYFINGLLLTFLEVLPSDDVTGLALLHTIQVSTEASSESYGCCACQTYERGLGPQEERKNKYRKEIPFIS